MHKVALLLATGFGLGYSPIASGTVGSIPGVLLVWFLFGRTGVMTEIVLAAVLTLLAIPICDVAEKHFKTKDDGRVVADEYMTFPVSMIGLPVHPVMLTLAFVTNRVFDIIKPPPARGLQRLTGGLGITIDDVFAALYSLAANWLLYIYLLKPQGWVP